MFSSRYEILVKSSCRHLFIFCTNPEIFCTKFPKTCRRFFRLSPIHWERFYRSRRRYFLCLNRQHWRDEQRFKGRINLGSRPDRKYQPVRSLHIEHRQARFLVCSGTFQTQIPVTVHRVLCPVTQGFIRSIQVNTLVSFHGRRINAMHRIEANIFVRKR